MTERFKKKNLKIPDWKQKANFKQAILIGALYEETLWLHSSVGRALHQYRGGHGFESIHFSLS